MSARRPAISLIHAPEIHPEQCWQVALDGIPAGPWLDERSARFAVGWLALARSDAPGSLAEIKAHCSLESAMGLPEIRRPEPAVMGA